MTEFVELTIDEKVVRVPKGTTVYTAAKELGIELPIFCYQDRMPPFGACRVCLVEVDKMPKLQTSCTLEAINGMVVRTQADPAVKAREEILEFLLINHPLDCPICDRGGECPLQDQALKFGPEKSRFFEDKRRFVKPYPLGPVLMLDRERCVACARCTRFGDIVAGDHALEFIERGYKMEVGTADGKAPKSKFIGNTIMICPVGALTSQAYRFRARPWDNEQTKTTCTLCPVGCSMILDSRDGEVMRTRSQENKEVNDIWMCDKGWFGYEFSSSAKRLTQPLMRRHGELVPVSWDDAFNFVAEKIKAYKGQGLLAALGGNTLTVEENYLLRKLMHDCAGVDHVDHGSSSSGMQITIGECENIERVLILGLDITEEFPVIWLRLKQAINKGCKVIFAGHFAPEIARYLQETLLHTPGTELVTLENNKERLKAFLSQGEKSAIFVGRQYLATLDQNAIVAELLSWKSKATLNILEGSNNSVGASYAASQFAQGLKTSEVLEAATSDGWDFLYIVGKDVASKYPSKLWNQAREKIGCLVVQDLFMTKTAEEADLVLPTLSFVEKGGSFLNIEHRVQKLKPGKAIPKRVYADSYIFVKIARALGVALVIPEEFLDSLKEGERLPLTLPEQHDTAKREAAKTELVATFAPALFDQGVRMKENVQLSQLAKCPHVRIHPSVAAKRNLQEGDSIFIVAEGKQIPAKVTIDDRVADNTVVIPLGFDDLPVQELGPHLYNGLPVQLAKK